MKKIAVALAAALIAGVGAYWILRADEKQESVKEAPAAPALVAAPPVVTTPAASATATAAVSAVSPPEAFAKQLEATQSTLPTAAKVKALPLEEKHGTPAMVLQAGVQIADIADAIEKDPSLAPQGINFYSKCAHRSELPISVRTVCLSGLRDLSAQTGTSADETGIDAAVVKLTNQMKSGK